MHKNILIAGLAVALTAGVALAQNRPPAPPTAPPAAPRGPADPAAPGFGFGGDRGFRGGPGGPGQRRFMRQPPTAQEVQQRNAAQFARMDVNRDGRVTFEEFRQDLERQRLERQRQIFQRFSGEQDSVTLDQLNARALERLNDRGRGRGPGDGGPRGGPPGQPAQPPAARPAR